MAEKEYAVLDDVVSPEKAVGVRTQTLFHSNTHQRLLALNPRMQGMSGAWDG